MIHCMFNCVDDTLSTPDHWELKCRGNPDVKNPSEKMTYE